MRPAPAVIPNAAALEGFGRRLRYNRSDSGEQVSNEMIKLNGHNMELTQLFW